jgi:hypothetical protein
MSNLIGIALGRATGSSAIAAELARARLTLP